MNARRNSHAALINEREVLEYVPRKSLLLGRQTGLPGPLLGRLVEPAPGPGDITATACPVNRLGQQQGRLDTVRKVDQAPVERDVAPEQRPDDRQWIGTARLLPWRRLSRSSAQLVDHDGRTHRHSPPWSTLACRARMTAPGHTRKPEFGRHAQAALNKQPCTAQRAPCRLLLPSGQAGLLRPLLLRAHEPAIRRGVHSLGQPDGLRQHQRRCDATSHRHQTTVESDRHVEDRQQQLVTDAMRSKSAFMRPPQNHEQPPPAQRSAGARRSGATGSSERGAPGRRWIARPGECARG